MSQAQSHSHVLANFGTLYATVDFTDYDNVIGSVTVHAENFSTTIEFCEFFDNPTQRDFAIAGAFKELASLAMKSAEKQKAWAIKNGFPT